MYADYSSTDSYLHDQKHIKLSFLTYSEIMHLEKHLAQSMHSINSYYLFMLLLASTTSHIYTVLKSHYSILSDENSVSHASTSLHICFGHLLSTMIKLYTAAEYLKPCKLSEEKVT